MEARIYILKCLTNLHVGNGDVNFNIIDNEVEKDVLTNYPTIHSSGVKGALRAHFEQAKVDKSIIAEIFGGETPNKKTEQGQLKFLSAKLLAQPFQNQSGQKNKAKPYGLKSPDSARSEFLEHLEVFVKGNNQMVDNILSKYKVETISNDDYEKTSLPVLARNHLVNGKSENLWYEEVVPHQTFFYLTVLSSVNDTSLLDKFEVVVHNKVVQFGANASIGYGLCQFVDVIKM